MRRGRRGGAGARAAVVYDGQLTLPSRQLCGVTATLDDTTGAAAGQLSLTAADARVSGDYT